jgi:hypothetical protein
MLAFLAQVAGSLWLYRMAGSGDAMTAAQIGSIALALGALGVLLLGMAALLRASAASRAERALADALERRMAALEAARTAAPDDGAARNR